MFKMKSTVKDKINYINISDVEIENEALLILPRYFCEKKIIIPMKIDYTNKTISIIAKDIVTNNEKEYIKFLCGYEPVFYYVKEKEELKSYIKEALKNNIIKTLKNNEKAFKSNLDVRDKESPAIKLVDTILKEAITYKSSDIHIEPFRKFYKIRFRVDGNLREIFRFNKASYNSVITRIKVLSKIDISEKRLPQDGRLSIKEKDKLWDLRVSTMPTINGEKIVIRIFQDDNRAEDIEDIGLANDKIELVRNLINIQNGIILAAGPTGSGKSTTLYTLLKQIDVKTKNIVTIEDPVEQNMEDIVQINVNQAIGFDFASGLRSILRQDPDIIMVGEIRDKETASIAMRSAITGHMVFSTIHTFDSSSVIDRLLDMGVEAYMIASGIRAIISQRLVRKICNCCREEYEPNEFEIKFLDIDKNTSLFRGQGCDKCGYTGYCGRTGVFEIMEVKEEHKKAILNKQGSSDIKKISVENGMITLDEACKNLVRKGVTTIAEITNICS